MTNRLTQNTEHKTQNTKHRTQNTKHRTQNTEHKTQNTEHRTQNTEHKTQNTEHKTQNTEHKTQNKNQSESVSNEFVRKKALQIIHIHSYFARCSCVASVYNKSFASHCDKFKIYNLLQSEATHEHLMKLNNM